MLFHMVRLFKILFSSPKLKNRTGPKAITHGSAQIWFIEYTVFIVNCTSPHLNLYYILIADLGKMMKSHYTAYEK